MFNLLLAFIKEFIKTEDGAETMEYVVIVAIIVTLGSAAYTAGLGPTIAAAFAAMVAAIPG